MRTAARRADAFALQRLVDAIRALAINYTVSILNCSRACGS